MNPQLTEFYAENPQLHPNSCFGCQRWGKDWMISFSAKDVGGKQMTYENGIHKVFDIFLDEKSMEKIFYEWRASKKK